MDFKSLVAARQKVEVKQTEQTDKFKEIFSLGMKYFYESFEKDNFPMLKKAAEAFAEAIKYRPSRFEPYLFLSQIFYALDNNKLSINYIKIAESLKPELEEIKAFKRMLFSLEAKKYASIH